MRRAGRPGRGGTILAVAVVIAAVVAAVVAAATLASAAPDESPGRAPPSPETAAPQRVATAKDVDAAVRRGVAFLVGRQDRDGSFGAEPGETALCLLALRHAGIGASDPAAVRAAASLERELPDGTVYGASLGLAALLTQDREAHAKKAAALVRELTAAQCENGQWSYASRRRAPPSGDNSNTQLAVFGLAAARARGIEVPREMFARCLAFLVRTRNEDGGWGYAERQRARSYGSMTAGGAMAVVLCASAAEPAAEVPPRERPEVLDALRWLARDFDPAENTGAGEAFGSRRNRRGDEFWRHYFLWSVERACAAAGADRLGPHDWHADGTVHLLGTQREDGSWNGPERANVATAFALLFLRRASRAVLTPSGTSPTTPR